VSRYRRIVAAVGAVLALAAMPAAAVAQAPTYAEPYRPQFHFTPAQNWMNDPNGMVYYQGEYHLFFQYNPFGDTWGHMSWGHAVSTDLVHWRQLPLAIPEQGDEMVFSGSAVVDYGNTSGLGTTANPPMVAIYTAAKPGSQAQALAYSTDKGRTWTRYAGNPVLDIGSAEFRDPKVFWYAPEHKWVMAVVMAVEHKVRLYSSKNLKDWTLMSDFGPANAVGGVWECPDLFPLAVDGDPAKTKWVMVVNLNPGGIQGGSAGQYFVGDFDGTRFTADNVAGPYTPPAGTVFEGFDGATYDGWTATGNAFGDGPAQGNVPPQGGVTGYVGSGLANSFHHEDGGTGTLTSPEFTIAKPYINFLVGGGEHAYDPTSGDAPPPAGTVLADFEGDNYGDGWSATGTFAGTRPPAGTIGDQNPVSGFEGRQLVNTFIDHDNGTGHITSPEFTITKEYVNFLVGGGNHPYPGTTTNRPTSVNLVVDGAVVRTKTGRDAETLLWTNWNVSDLKGKTARIDIVDENTGGWGHILADQITLADAPAFPRSTETAVNLLVDGKVLRTTTGPNSETLDWRAWNVSELAGKTARIQLVDRNTGGWGHILADQFSFADQAAQSLLDRASWLDYGKDYYAAVSWNDAPGGKRIMIGWMNNWLYGGATPTSPWRSAMSVPREVALRTVDGRPQLVQQPVASLDALETGQRHDEDSSAISGERTLTKRGDVLDIRATLRPGSASRMGLKVLTNTNGDETVIGYDVAAGMLSIDRTRSGAAAAEIPGFPGVHSAPVPLRDGRLKLRILVDRSLVEVFAQDGERTIADQVYPTPGSDGLKVFATGGAATLESLDVRELRTTWGALETSTPGGVGGTVPATLALTLGPPAGFGPFQPGVTREYTASTNATVISTAGDAALTVADPSSDHPGRLVNGAFFLPQPLSVGGSTLPATVKTWAQPVSNDAVTIPFTQSIAATDALRTGTYSKTLTFTLSTTTP
jgi:levanase